MTWAFTNSILPVCSNHTVHYAQSFPHALAICYHELSKVKCCSSVTTCRSDLLVSDVPAVGTFMLAVLPLCFQVQQVHLGIHTTWSKSAAKWGSWDKKKYNICSKTTKSKRTEKKSKQMVETGLGFCIFKK